MTLNSRTPMISIDTSSTFCGLRISAVSSPTINATMTLIQTAPDSVGNRLFRNVPPVVDCRRRRRCAERRGLELAGGERIVRTVARLGSDHDDDRHNRRHDESANDET